MLGTCSIFVADNCDSNDFAGFSLTRIVPLVPGNLPSNVTNATSVSADAEATATVTITATIPLAFNSTILPADVRDQYDYFINPTDITT